jgi:lipid-binding SYLF domain-containing protein
MSLNGSSLSPDSDANERYGKPLSAREIVVGNVAKPTPGGQPLVSLLNTQISKHAK